MLQQGNHVMAQSVQHSAHRRLASQAFNKMNITKYGLDSECRMDSPNLFKGGKSKADVFQKYFRTHCQDKVECEIDKNYFNDKISAECQDRYA